MVYHIADSTKTEVINTINGYVLMSNILKPERTYDSNRRYDQNKCNPKIVSKKKKNKTYYTLNMKNAAVYTRNGTLTLAN